MRLNSFVTRISPHNMPQHHSDNAWLVIGNFDGVHLGHQTLIRSGIASARNKKVPCKILTFEPHPRQYFNKELVHFRLTSLRLKLAIIQNLGIDHVLMLPFVKNVADMSANDFMKKMLTHAAGVTVGKNFTFGYKRGGNPDTLKQFGVQHGFNVDIHDLTDESHASRAIRTLLKNGDIRAAAKDLGRFWTLSGRVITGRAQARTLGYPTANILLGNQFAPRYGVYKVNICIDGTTYSGVANIGIKPTYSDDFVPHIETHIFDFSGDLYGKLIYIECLDFLRDEVRFENVEQLKKQIAQDIALARNITNV